MSTQIENAAHKPAKHTILCNTPGEEQILSGRGSLVQNLAQKTK